MTAINWKKRFEKAAQEASRWYDLAEEENVEAGGGRNQEIFWQMAELVFNYLDQARYARLQNPKMGYKCLCDDLNATLGRAEMFLRTTRACLTGTKGIQP